MKAKKKVEEADFTVKIVIVGDSGVGKTNILFRFCDNEFKTSYVATIGVDFKNKVLKVGESKIKMQIWDTAGQERFKNINQTYFKGAMGVILTYSITDQASFDNLCNCTLRQRIGSGRSMSTRSRTSLRSWSPTNAI